MNVVEEMKRLTERYAELEKAKEEVEVLIMTMQDIDLPSGIEGSHHAEMEWEETLEQIENEMQEIEDKIR
jgi:prefoldin subunit 5